MIGRALIASQRPWRPAAPAPGPARRPNAVVLRRSACAPPPAGRVLARPAPAIHGARSLAHEVIACGAFLLLLATAVLIAAALLQFGPVGLGPLR